MLQTLITSKTRVKLLLKFFLNSSNTSHLRDLASEFHESTNAIRLELNHLEQAGMLTSHTQGNKKVFQANQKHPLFGSIYQLLLMHTGIDQVIDHVISKLGGLHSAYLVGHFARGIDNTIIELLLVGKNLDMEYLERMVAKAESLISRHVRYVIIDPLEIQQIVPAYPEAFLLWKSNL